jgi:hypothetical protein
LQFICANIGALQNATSTETGKLCADYLGPALRLLNVNSPPFALNSFLLKSADPANIIYSDPSLAPGGAGAPPSPDEPPTVSTYTGLNNDVGAARDYGQPPAVAPGPTAPDHLPATPMPALFPGAPIPGPSTFAPGAPTDAAPNSPGSGRPLPAEAPAPVEGTPPS